MKELLIKNTDIKTSSLALGCMRMNESGRNIPEVINQAYDSGITFFDHADIYGKGTCEEIFASSLKKTSISRNSIYLQSKCGIVPGLMYDSSKEHILSSVEESLKRLNTDYLDSLLLHRPDALVEPDEVAEAFYQLKKAGKVRYFGVSNHNPSQIELLKTAVKDDLVINQMQFGLKHSSMIDQGINVNIENQASLDRDGGILDYARINNMTMQAWSPFQYGMFEGVFLTSDKFSDLNAFLKNMADKYNTTPTGLSYAWINRHPANIQTIVGSMNVNRLSEIANASDIILSREDWYAIYKAAGNELP